MSIGGILVALIAIAILMLVSKYIMDWMELDPPLRKIGLLLVGLFCLLILLSQFGVLGDQYILWKPVPQSR